jgi:ABC-type dipeptide/oligopeptide/nickel transport system permease subunit
VIALGTVVWVTYARVVRAETLKLRELEFVQAARTIGASKAHILFRHVLPNVLYTVIVLATLDVSVVIVAESGLSYLGLGVQPPTPTWGGMIADGQVQLAQSPWIVLGPAAVLTLTVIAINLVGDWLRDVLDPSLRVQ